MTQSAKTMTVFSANPFLFVFMVVAILVVIGIAGYSLYDRVGLEVRSVEAIVTGKQYNPPGTTYTTEVIGGQNVVKANERAETYVVTLKVADEPTIAVVTKATFDSLNDGDVVKAQVRRTRRSKRLEAVAVTR